MPRTVQKNLDISAVTSLPPSLFTSLLWNRTLILNFISSSFKAIMSKAQIIVIAVGVPVVAAIIVIACALHFRRRRHMKKECPVEAPPESTRHDKDIILSPKQILGLDDDTYLSHLPSKCKTSHLQVDRSGLTTFLQCLTIHGPLQSALPDSRLIQKAVGAGMNRQNVIKSKESAHGMWNTNPIQSYSLI